jgi:FMN-dependent NADH-azoreductase
MPQLLHLDSGADPTGSVSRALTAVFAAAWSARPDHTTTYRDLHASPLPHLEHSALHWPEATWPADTVPPAAAALRQAVLGELLEADVVLIGAPMYNYSMASTLKAWIDRIHLPGATTGDGTTPLAGRRAVVVSTRGLGYGVDSPQAGWDHVVPPLLLVLETALGMQVDVVTVDHTLAASVPALAAFADRGRTERAAAEGRLAELGATL